MLSMHLSAGAHSDYLLCCCSNCRTTFYHFFVWALVLGALAANFLHKFR